jgi:hypothetical protein
MAVEQSNVFIAISSTGRKIPFRIAPAMEKEERKLALKMAKTASFYRIIVPVVIMWLERQKVVLLFCTEPQINDTLDPTTMLSLKTTIATLIAALSVIATASAVPALIPQAFAQAIDDNNDDDDNGGNTVTATQSNSFTANVDQSQTQYTGDNGDDDDDDDRADTTQTASQGFCLQANQQNAAAGNDATNTGVNAIVANNQSSVNCS